MNTENSALCLVQKVTGLPGFTNAIGTSVLFAEPGEVHMEIERRPDPLQFNGFSMAE